MSATAASASLVIVMPKGRARLRLVAWACLLVVLFAAALPTAAGVTPAILAFAGPVISRPGLTTPVRAAHDDALPDSVAATEVPARAPPLA